GYFNLGLLLDEMKQFAEAERAYRSGLALQEQLVRGSPKNSTYAVDLAKSCGELGTLASDQGRHAEALEFCNKAIQALEPITRTNPQISTQSALAVTYTRRAEALSRLGQHDEAVRDWDRALVLIG